MRGVLSTLEPTPHSDAGTCRALAEALAQHILALRREQEDGLRHAFKGHRLPRMYQVGRFALHSALLPQGTASEHYFKGDPHHQRRTPTQ